MSAIPLVIIIGPTASGKSARAIAEAQKRNGEIISVDSRQVYRTLDIGTEKTPLEARAGIPHHLIDIREPEETYSAGDFVADATALIRDIHARGKTPILAGGSHFYIDALIHGLTPETPVNEHLRTELASLSSEELYTRLQALDPKRAQELDPKNPRRLVRALEIVAQHGTVPKRTPPEDTYVCEWIVINPEPEVLKQRIDARLEDALAHGLIEEVAAVRARVGDARLQELGLEYRIVSEHLRGERTKESLFPALSAALWQYARRQKAWLRKLAS